MNVGELKEQLAFFDDSDLVAIDAIDSICGEDDPVTVHSVTPARGGLSRARVLLTAERQLFSVSLRMERRLR